MKHNNTPPYPPRAVARQQEGVYNLRGFGGVASNKNNTPVLINNICLKADGVTISACFLRYWPTPHYPGQDIPGVSQARAARWVAVSKFGAGWCCSIASGPRTVPGSLGVDAGWCIQILGGASLWDEHFSEASG